MTNDIANTTTSVGTAVPQPASPVPAPSSRPDKTSRKVIAQMILAGILVLGAAFTVIYAVVIVDNQYVALGGAAVAAACLFIRPVLTAFARSEEISDATESRLKGADVTLAVVAAMTGAPVIAAKVIELWPLA